MRIRLPKLLICASISITIYVLATMTTLHHYHKVRDITTQREVELTNTFKNFVDKAPSKSNKETVSPGAVQTSRPPLEKLFQKKGRKIIADVSWLLDVAVIAFPKCGTTTMLQYLNTEEIKFVPYEQCQMNQNRTYTTMRRIYNRIPPNHVKRGIKCPTNLISKNARTQYLEYFYKTNFIVGVRHPVLWFQSYYNFQVQWGETNHKRYPHPNELIDKGWMGVSAKRSKFHYYLSTLGKTQVTDEEQKLIQPDAGYEIIPTPVKVFLYDIEQLGDKNETRTSIFRDDLRQYLGLKRPLPSMIKVKPEERYNLSKSVQAFRDSKKINICDKQNDKVRGILVETATNASRWIRDYFLKSEDVVVSSRYFLEESLRRWEQDPCDMNN